jgi:hypothetical protein
VVHGHDDGRAAEGAVARGEDLGVFGAHALEVGPHPVPVHQALRLLADGGDHHAAVDLVLRARDRHRPAAAVLRVGLAHLGAHTGKRQLVALLHHRHLLGVVDELDALLEGALELVLAGRDLLRAAAVDHFYVLAAGHAERRAAGIHRDVAAADHHHGLGQLWALAGVDPAQEGDAVDYPRVVLAGDSHVLAPPGPDGEQHRVVLLL